MKKIMMILAFSIMAAAISTAAFAASYPNTYGTDSFDVGGTTTMVVKTSKNVYCQVSNATSGSGASTIAVNYVVQCYHNAGSRTFGTSNADQKLFFYDATGQTLVTAPTAAGVAPSWNGWQVL